MEDKSGIRDEGGPPEVGKPDDQTPAEGEMAVFPAVPPSAPPAAEKHGYESVSPIAASLDGGPGTGGFSHGTKSWDEEGEIIE